tara:strand:- start:703 stop:1155 length:453 start_codon:yes stop_codon:yes gene_type:complete
MSVIKLKNASIKDGVLIYNWFNDKDNIRYKIKTKNKISLRDHLVWLKRFNKKKLGIIWIIIYENKKIGNIRLTQLKYKTYEVDIFLIKKYRGKSFATESLLKVENKLDKRSVIYSYIKKNNFRSLNFFLKNRYNLYSSNKTIWFLKKQLI